MRDQAAISVVGGGLYPPETISLEGLGNLRSATTVFAFADVAGLEDVLLGSPAALSVVDGLAEYGASRRLSYQKVIAPILKAAVANPPVSWVCSGNPGYIDGVSFTIVEEAAKAGIATVVIPGISAIDAILCECNLVSPASSFQLYSASEMITLEIVPNPVLPTVVFQVARAETLLEIGMGRPKPKALDRLARLLAQAYGDGHEAVLITCRRGPSTETRRVAGPDCRLSCVEIDQVFLGEPMLFCGKCHSISPILRLSLELTGRWLS